MLEVKQESIKDCWEEVVELGAKHWQETEEYRHGYEFNPDIPSYVQSEKNGVYHVYIARVNGVMVGYLGCYLLRSMHTQVLTCIEDAWFVLPEYRNTKVGVNLYNFVEDDMKAKNVISINMHAKHCNNAGKVMEKLGFEPVGTLFVKHLKEVQNNV